MNELSDLDLSKYFEYENKFYLASPVQRIAKFAAHLDLFRLASGCMGDIVECGVYKGASLFRFLKFRALFENTLRRKVIAFDTFGEFPEAQYELDKAKRKQFVEEGGIMSVSEEYLEHILTSLNLYINVELVKGNILQTIADYKKRNPKFKISLLHVDVDLYEATKVCMEELYPLVGNGGIVILDDYNKFAGATKAIDECFAGKRVEIKKLPYCASVSYVEVCK